MPDIGWVRERCDNCSSLRLTTENAVTKDTGRLIEGLAPATPRIVFGRHDNGG